MQDDGYFDDGSPPGRRRAPRAGRVLRHRGHDAAAPAPAARWRSAFRYVWPAKLDLMAQLAGMELRDRFGGWKREPFTSESREHVSVRETRASW